MQAEKIVKIDIKDAGYKVLTDLKAKSLLASFSIVIGECNLGMDGIMALYDIILIYCTWKMTHMRVNTYLCIGK